MKRIPDWLTTEAKKLWKKHAHLLKDDRDAEAYTMLIVSLSEWRACLEIVEREGRSVSTDRGGVKAHPLMPTIKQHADVAAKMLGKFKMTPDDRDQQDITADDEELDELLAG